MVVLGGLEFVAAGYLIHKYSKSKEEERRIEEEEDRRRERNSRRSRSEYRRKHSHEHRRHSRERKHRYDDEHHSHDPRPRPQPQPQLQYLAQPAPPPLRASSAPPPREGYYPPTGWPQEWKQSQRPERSADPSATDYTNHPKYVESISRPDPKDEAAAAAYYAQFQGREDADRKRHRPRGRSESRPHDRILRNDTNSVPPSPHVRFAAPDDEDSHIGDRWDPPPEYRV